MNETISTLATISRFWNREAEHLTIAELICYDGTPRHRGREWAEQNGFALREFRVTWESTIALLDRGIPFTLTTVEPTNGHMQAVIGYDERRGTILMRDPFVRLLGEALGEELLKRQRPFFTIKQTTIADRHRIQPTIHSILVVVLWTETWLTIS